MRKGRSRITLRRPALRFISGSVALGVLLQASAAQADDLAGAVTAQAAHFRKVVLNENENGLDRTAPIRRWEGKELTIAIIQDEYGDLTASDLLSQLQVTAVLLEDSTGLKITFPAVTALTEAQAQIEPGTIRIYVTNEAAFAYALKRPVPATETGNDGSVRNGGAVSCSSALQMDPAQAFVRSAEILVDWNQDKSRAYTCATDRVFAALGFQGRETVSPCGTIRCSEKEPERAPTRRDFVSLRMLYALAAGQAVTAGAILDNLPGMAEAALHPGQQEL